MRSLAPKLLMVGMSCLDHCWQVEQFPPIGSRTPANAYRVQGGGPAATAAVTAARLGADVSLWSVHGRDQNGDALTSELEGYGVNVTYVTTVEGACTPVSAVLSTAEGERHIFPYRDPRLATYVAGQDPPAFAGSACVLCDTRYPQLAKKALRQAVHYGIPTVGDFGDAAAWDLAWQVDHLIVSEECAKAVAGAAWDVGNLVPAFQALRQFDGQILGITLGGDGFAYEVDNVVRRAAAFRVDVADTTGAGDVFHGAYAYAVAMEWSAQERAQFACAAAALSCRGIGREKVPTLYEVLSLIRVSSQ